MRMPSSKFRTIAIAAATPVAILLASALVWQSSYAAFSGTTRSSGNDWATGSVNLTDDDSGSARFQVANMTPGQTETKCIAVTATASGPGLVKAYLVNPVSSPQGLESRVKMTVNAGTGGTFADCTGFVANGPTIVSDTSLADLAPSNEWDKGVGGWTVGAGTQTRVYQFTWRFDTTNMTQSQVNALQGARTGIDVQWELQTN